MHESFLRFKMYVLTSSQRGQFKRNNLTEIPTTTIFITSRLSRSLLKYDPTFKTPIQNKLDVNIQTNIQERPLTSSLISAAKQK